MKNLIGFFIILFCTNLFSQDYGNRSFSKFKFGFLAGVNVTKFTGGSVLIEEKTNLTSHINMKVMIGYSKIIKKEGYNVKTNEFIDIADYQKYVTESYDIDRIDYDVFPMAIGFEYFIFQDRLSPYIISEAGYNFYSYHIQESNINSGVAGYYDTYDEIPVEYKNKPPKISDEVSYLFGLGIGTNYRIGSTINLDIRYIYQFNKNIVNTNQLLVGIIF
ncbi:MAG: hypothetical protein P8Z35_17265 [Ignavibacteriaceae bacterium]